MHDAASAFAEETTPAPIGPDAQITATTETAQRRGLALAGALYGLLWGLAFAAGAWGYDALVLDRIGAYNAWVKLILGLIASVPIAVLVSTVAQQFNRLLFRILVWGAGAAAIAFLAGPISYQGWGLGYDPYPPGRAMYPFSGLAGARTALTMVVAVGFGVATALIEEHAVGAAWANASRRGRLTAGSLFSLAIRCLPLAILLAYPADHLLNGMTRPPLLAVADAIDTAENPNVDLKAAGLRFLTPLREQLYGPRTIYMNTMAVDVDTGSSSVDVFFANGLLLRCQYGNEAIVTCADLGTAARRWMIELATEGHLTEATYDVRAERDVRSWLAAWIPSLGKPRDAAIDADVGGWFYMRTVFDSGRAIDCRFSGDKPVVVDYCIEVGASR